MPDTLLQKTEYDYIVELADIMTGEYFKIATGKVEGKTVDDLTDNQKKADVDFATLFIGSEQLAKGWVFLNRTITASEQKSVDKAALDFIKKY